MSCYTFNFGKFCLKSNIVKKFIHTNNCHRISDIIYIYKELLHVKCRLLYVKIIDIFILLQAGLKNWDFKQLNVIRTTVHRVEQRLKASESLNNIPRSGGPQIISQETIKKAFENNLCQRITRQHRRKIFQSPLWAGWSKRWEENVWEIPGNSCWVSNGSEASGEKNPFVEWPEQSGESNTHFLLR